MKRSIGLDMDNVITDTIGAFVTDLNQHHQVPMDVHVLAEKFHHKQVSPEEKELYHRIMTRPGFFRGLPWMDVDCPEIVRALQKDYDVYIVTAAMHLPTCIQEKIDWLQENLPFVGGDHYIFCGKKDVIHTDFLIDDNIDRYPGYLGVGLCYDTVMNRHRDINAHRVASWQHIADYFRL